MGPITIAGAGPTGCLMAVYLARRGYTINIYESRPDNRTQRSNPGRSINLALSHRGFRALEQAGLLTSVRDIAVPIKGRQIHTPETTTPQTFIYGRNSTEINYSVSRHTLNQVLLEAADSYDAVTLHFEEKVDAVDMHQHILKTSKTAVSFDTLIAADGANSRVRQSLVSQGLAQFTLQKLPYGYKELRLPAEKATSLDPNYLHIWPRGDFMLMGLANTDGSMTMTLFMPHEGDVGLQNLTTEGTTTAFFQTHMPDVLALDPQMPSRLLENPISDLSTVEGGPWHAQNNLLMLGDAVHTIVPFFGQGINCAFEDCRLLDEHLETFGLTPSTFQTFSQHRKIHTDAIMNMAAENYDEMKRQVAEPSFKYKKKIEAELMRRFGDVYISRYVLVSYTHQPYDIVYRTGRIQQKLLDKISTQFPEFETIHWDDVTRWIQDYKTDIQTLTQNKDAA